MKSLTSALAEFDVAFSRAVHRPNKAAFKRLFEAVRANIGSFTLEARATTVGCSVVTYVRGKINASPGGVGFRTKNSTDLPSVTRSMVEAVAKARGLATLSGFMDIVANAIEPDVAGPLEIALQTVHNLATAAIKAEDNQKIVDGQRRQDALESLADLFGDFPFTREEVLAAWDLDQVKRVMES
jgi:hypothetical protein